MTTRSSTRTGPGPGPAASLVPGWRGGLLKAGWLLPTMLGSGMLWLFVLALLPGLLALAGFVAMLVLLVLLATGGLEAPVLRLLTPARVLTPGERSVLTPVLVPLAGRGLVAHPYAHPFTQGGAAAEAGQLLMCRSRHDAVVPAVMHGRCGRGKGGDSASAAQGTLVVSPWLVEAVGCGAISQAEAGALIVHAVGRHRAAGQRFEVAQTVWLLPWRAVTGLVTAVAARFARFPMVGPAWKVRGVVGVVAVVQSVAEGRAISGVLGGLFVALTYLVPAARRAWDTRLARAGDILVIHNGLGPVLAGLMSRHGRPLPRERSQRLSASGSIPLSADPGSRPPPQSDPSGEGPVRHHLRLVRS